MRRRLAGILLLVATCAAQSRNGAASYRRLEPDSFPDLPPSIVSVLRVRGCLVPQPLANGSPRNVIRGEFFEKGHDAWAVLCSVHGFSSILVFRNATEQNPAELARRSEQLYRQRTWDGRAFYARQIDPVDRKSIMDRYRGLGGPKPPPIDHQGINDAMLEKASEVYYWYRGQWRKLTGDD